MVFVMRKKINWKIWNIGRFIGFVQSKKLIIRCLASFDG